MSNTQRSHLFNSRAALPSETCLLEHHLERKNNHIKHPKVMSFVSLTKFECAIPNEKENTGLMFCLHARSGRLKAQKAGNPQPNAARSLKRRRLSVRLSLCLLSKTTPKSKRRRCEAERGRTEKATRSLRFTGLLLAEAAFYLLQFYCLGAGFSCYPWDKLSALALANSHWSLQGKEGQKSNCPLSSPENILPWWNSRKSSWKGKIFWIPGEFPFLNKDGDYPTTLMTLEFSYHFGVYERNLDWALLQQKCNLSALYDQQIITIII